MRVCLLFLLTLFALLFLPHRVTAQTSYGIALPVEISESVKDGDIISLTKSGYKKSVTPFDPFLYGVITDTPSLDLENTEKTPNTRFVITSGRTHINVLTAAGIIHKNDSLTSSTTAGVSEKAEDTGFIVGTALEDYTNKDPKAVGKILANINPHYSAGNSASRTNLIKNVRNFTSGAFLAPLDVLRYSIAGLLTTASFVIAFVYFGKVAIKSIESMGRNPLAGRIIQASVLLNVLLAIGIIGIGLGISYLILIL